MSETGPSYAAPRPPALADAVARMSGRLAAVLEALDGNGPAAAFLRGHEQAASGAPPADGSCLELPRPGTEEPIHHLLTALRPQPLEVDLLVLAAAAHHHEGIASVLRSLHPEAKPWPTVGLAGLLAEHGVLAGPGGRPQVLSALTRGTLLRSGALALAGDGPFSERTLLLAPLLWENLVLGSDAHRDGAGPAAEVDDDGWSGPGSSGGPWPAGCTQDLRPLPAAGLDQWLRMPAVRAAGAAIEQDRMVAVAATADRPGAVAGRLGALVAAAGRRPVVVHVPRLDDALVRWILLLALARSQVPVLWSELPPNGTLPAAGLPLPLLIVRPPREPDGPDGAGRDAGTVDAWPRPVLEVPVGPLGREDRRRMIADALPELVLPAHPVGPATLEPCDVAVAAADLRVAAALGGGRVDAGRLIDAVDRRTAAAVPGGAVLVHPTAGWEDLVLPPDRLRQLLEAVGRFRAQDTVFGDWGFLPGRAGRAGLRLLFSGPPGTGKTLAAEVMAGALGRDLLVIDLSRLVSKWLGETEKNLSAAFDAAERGGCALFFDEADALFGKRTEVGDARDRYANLETAYLLSKLERFDGVAILASNLRQNLDAAFARRLDFIVAFDQPDPAGRAALWRRHLPASAPVAPSVDVDRLAALYDLPGALIRNAAVAAAFLAASGGGEPEGSEGSDPAGASPAIPGPITVQHVVHALRREYAKAGLAFPGAPAGMAAGRPAGWRPAEPAVRGAAP